MCTLYTLYIYVMYIYSALHSMSTNHPHYDIVEVYIENNVTNYTDYWHKLNWNHLKIIWKERKCRLITKYYSFQWTYVFIQNNTIYEMNKKRKNQLYNRISNSPWNRNWREFNAQSVFSIVWNPFLTGKKQTHD